MSGQDSGTVVAICVSAEKGTVKRPVPRAELKSGHGIVGDAHAGQWPRQVSLLPKESIDRMREIMSELVDGDFAENIVTAGVNFATVEVGDRYRLGEKILLEVTQIGKECHESCAIKQTVGDCIMPREGIFCRVLQGGPLRTGDLVRKQQS